MYDECELSVINSKTDCFLRSKKVKPDKFI